MPWIGFQKTQKVFLNLLSEMHRTLMKSIRRFWLKKLPIRQKYLMPAADNKDDLERLYPRIIEHSKQYGFSLGQRFHISMWNQTTGI